MYKIYTLTHLKCQLKTRITIQVSILSAPYQALPHCTSMFKISRTHDVLHSTRKRCVSNIEFRYINFRETATHVLVLLALSRYSREMIELHAVIAGSVLKSEAGRECII